MLLALTRDRGGRTWRLADACAACAAATSHTAVVPDTLLSPRRPAASALVRTRVHGDEPQRVREMLTHLASTLGCVTSPAARLLALQCALRADTHGRAQLPAGLLRGMRLHRHNDAWQELAQDGWLDPPAPRTAPLQVRLLDDAALNQAPGRSARRRAAHWALKPAPAHRCGSSKTRRPPDRPGPGRPHHPGRPGSPTWPSSPACAGTPQQTGVLLDRLVAGRTLSAWHHQRDTDEVHWQPAPLHRPVSGSTDSSAH